MCTWFFSQHMIQDEDLMYLKVDHLLFDILLKKIVLVGYAVFSMFVHYVNVSVLKTTHKVFTKDQCFYLNYHKFSIKSYVLDVY